MADPTAATEFRLDVTPAGAAVVIAVTGEVDMGTSPQLWAAIEGQSGTPRDVVLDLTGVSFLDSSGLAVLIRGHHLLTAEGGRLVLRNVSRPVGRTMAVAGLNALLNLEGGVSTETS
jgi:anti-sigma B factor antagonist